MGRKKEYQVRITLPITEEMRDRLDELKAADEDRLDLIRTSIERELKRRERKA